MKAKILHFNRGKKMRRKKQIDTPEFGAMIRNSQLIRSAIRRGYSLEAIKKLVRSAEDSRR